MDPLHITEFASERYFTKLKQLNETNEQASVSSHDLHQHVSTSTTSIITGSVSTQHESPGSTFTLPLGLPRQRHSNDDSYFLTPSEQRKRSVGHDLTSLRTQRRPSFTGALSTIRQRLTFHNHVSQLEHHPEVVLEEPQIKHIPGLKELFFALPTELQAQIIATLPIHDILNLRLISRSYHALVSLNEASIARYHIAHSLPHFALRLYPSPAATEVNLHYVCGIWHRLHVAAKLAKVIADQTTKEIFLRTSPHQQKEFEPQHERMQQRLMPLLFAVFHFFETYRDLHAHHLMSGGNPLAQWPHTINPIEAQVMEAYDDETLLKVHQVFPLIMACFTRRLRPPSYVGTVEKTLKGYLRDKPVDEVYAAILAIGGLRQAQRFWETKGYNARRAAVDTWYGYVTKLSPDTGASKKRSFIARIKMKHQKDHKRTVPVLEGHALDHPPHGTESCHEWFCVKPVCSPGECSTMSPASVLVSSLTMGPPMDHLQPINCNASSPIYNL